MSTLKFAFRSLVKTPFISCIAIVSLALGLGANAAIFSLFEHILLRSLPVQQPQQLVNLCSTGPISGSISTSDPGSCVFSHPMFRDLEQVDDVFDGVAGYRSFGANVSYQGSTEGADGMSVSGDYFRTLGVQPALGRVLSPEDDRTPGAHRVVVLSYDYWTSRFAQDPAVLNQPITLNGEPLTIVGVSGEGFKGTNLGNAPDFFVPIIMREALVPNFVGLDERRNYWVYSFARLARDQSLESAQTVANQRYRQIIQDVELDLQGNQTPAWLERFEAKTLELEAGSRGQSSMIEESKTPLLLLLSVTGFVLLIACANVANLLLTKAVDRSGEIALRMSLGARRSQVVAQLLAESVLLAVLGGLVGLAVARATLIFLASLLPTGGGAPPFPLTLGPIAWAFFGILTLVTSLVGLVPALKATRHDLADAMKAQTSKASGARSVVRFRMGLTVAQIAISMALLVAAGLFIKSLLNASRVDLGIDTPRIATFAMSPELNGYSPEESKNLFARVEQEVATQPGVASIAGSMVPLISGSNWTNNVEVDGYEAEPDENTNASFNAVGPGFFRTLGIPLIDGREFTEADVAGSPKVAIVNESFARRFELGRDAVGRFMQAGSGGENDIEIVGLVEDSKYAQVKQEIPPMYYMPYRQDEDLGFLNFYVRAQGDPSALLPTLRSAVQGLDPNLPVGDLRTMQTQVDEDLFLDGLLTKLSAGFALIATLLAAIGLYGTLAYSVSQRSGEIGLRMALGADSNSVLSMILRQVGILTLVGAVIGLGAALGLGRAAASLLYELEGHDPTVLIASLVLLVVVALLSGLAPALRASRIDPMIALRNE